MTTATEGAATRDPSPVPRPELRALLVPTLAVGAVAAILTAVAWGTPGLGGALAGLVLVVAFFGLTHVVMHRTRRLAPELSLLVALALYTAKVTALAVTFVLLSGLGLLGDPLHRGALALTVITCTLTWTGAEVRAATTARIPTYDLGGRTS